MILNPISGSSHRRKIRHQHYSTITSLVLVGVWRPMDSQIRHSVENPGILNFRVTDLNGRYKVAFSQPHLIHKKNVEYEHYFWAHTLQCGWGCAFIPWTFTNKNGFPKTFEANAKILGRCPCCVRLSPVALRIIEKDWRTEREAVCQFFSGMRWSVGEVGTRWVPYQLTNGLITSINGLIHG